MSPLPRLNLLALALLAGASVMVLELAAPRLVAPHLGTTALTWTAVIATFLAGIAWGNVIGGRHADLGDAKTLPRLFVLAALAAAATLPLYALASWVTGGLSHGWRVLLTVPLSFLPAAIVLGTLPPAIARALLSRGQRPGFSLGLVASAGALGSVGGTALAGFVLVPALGVRLIFLVSAGALLVGALVANRDGAPESQEPRDRPKPTVEALLPRAWAALAALAGAAILTVEIVAGRIAADGLGNSLYTWTSVIGVVLFGMALGAALGGWLADRFAPRPLLTWLLLAATVCVTAVLWAAPLVGLAEDFVADPGLSWPLATLLGTTIAFLIPALVLGTLSPVIVRAALADPEVDGRVVGGLYAWGTIGAVVATILVGYVFVPALGMERVIVLLACFLAIAAARLQPWLWVGYVGVLLLGLLAMASGNDAIRAPVVKAFRPKEEAAYLHLADSRYFRIRVRSVPERWVRLEKTPDEDDLYLQPLLEDRVWYERGQARLCWDPGHEMSVVQLARLRLAMRTEGDRRAAGRLRELLGHKQRYLSLDRLIHGYVDLDDPTWLGYDYERLYAAVIGRLWPRTDPVRCLFIGGGAYAFQRRLLEQKGDGLECVTSEIDPAVTQTGYDYLGLRDDPRHTIVHEDARTYVERLPIQDEGGFDFVFGDAFNDLAVPFHLTTREFAQALAARMEWGGVYLLNVIDIFDSGRFVGAFIATLEEVFDYVRLLSVAPRRDDARETFVVVASNRPLPLENLQDDWGRPLGATYYTRDELDILKRGAGGLVLTDDHAPVEILLAPVVRERTK